MHNRASPVATSPIPARVRIALTGVLICATLLVTRAYVPAWMVDRVPVPWSGPAALFVTFVVLGVAVVAIMALCDRLWSLRGGSLASSLAISALLIATVCGALLTVVYPFGFDLMFGREPRNQLELWLLALIVGLCVHASVLLHRAAAMRRMSAMRMQTDADALGTALDRAELSMLEAQIEPHFLFNTLAHIKREYRLDPDGAEQMLSALIAYLDHAVPALRQVDWTVGDELGLVRTYLGILGKRFGERLKFAIDASDEVTSLCLPALTIATLVENAVRHGVQPKPGGGTINVSVRINGTGLLIEVRDDGVGLRKSSGSGLGLSTVRARLRSAFGAGAMLTVEPVAAGGVLARIALPDGAQHDRP